MWIINYTKGARDDESENLDSYIERMHTSIMDGDYRDMPEVVEVFWLSADGSELHATKEGLDHINERLSGSWQDYLAQVNDDNGRWVDGEVFYG